MSLVDDAAKRVDALLDKLERFDPFGYRQRGGVRLEYAPRAKTEDGGPMDPWQATCANSKGTGQDAEMALLDLHANLSNMVRGVVDRARERIAEDARHADEMAALLRTAEKESTGQ